MQAKTLLNSKCVLTFACSVGNEDISLSLTAFGLWNGHAFLRWALAHTSFLRLVWPLADAFVFIHVTSEAMPFSGRAS